MIVELSSVLISTGLLNDCMLLTVCLLSGAEGVMYAAFCVFYHRKRLRVVAESNTMRKM